MKKGRRREVCREVTEGLPKGRWGEGEKMGWLLVFHNGFHLVDDLAAAVAGHLGVHADGDHVFVGGETTEVDGGGVLAEGLVISEVVGGCQLPAAITAEEAEVAGMVVEVAGIVVEDHAAELLLDGLGRLGEVAGELQKAVIIHLGWRERLVEQTAGGGHVEAVALVVKVEPLCGEIFSFHQAEFRHHDTGLLRQLVVVIFLLPDVDRVEGMAEFDEPMATLVAVQAFGSHATRVAATGQQEVRPLVGALRQYLEGKGLHLV